jgi:hypothetical protein
MLLTDEQATIAALEEQFGRLATCSRDDVVVIAFSGHGTETHELVGYDRRSLRTCENDDSADAAGRMVLA